MATFVSDQILGKPIHIASSRIVRTGWKTTSSGVPYPLLQVSDFSVSPTNRDTTETSVFGDARTGGANKTDVGDLGTTELALSGPVAHGSKGIELFRDSALNEKDLYLEYGIRGQIVNSWDGLDGDVGSAAADRPTFSVKAATNAGYTSEKKITFASGFQDDGTGGSFIDDIVAGYTIAFKYDGVDTVHSAHMWNVDAITESTNPEIIVSRLPHSDQRLINITVLPLASVVADGANDTTIPGNSDAIAGATETEGTIYLVRPHVFRQFRVRALAIPGESQTGAASLSGTYNFSLQEELDTAYLMPYESDFTDVDVRASTGID